MAPEIIAFLPTFFSPNSSCLQICILNISSKDRKAVQCSICESDPHTFSRYYSSKSEPILVRSFMTIFNPPGLTFKHHSYIKHKVITRLVYLGGDSVSLYFMLKATFKFDVSFSIVFLQCRFLLILLIDVHVQHS